MDSARRLNQARAPLCETISNRSKTNGYSDTFHGGFGAATSIGRARRTLRTDLQAEHLDHIAVTGDLTHLGLPQEFREAATWLARLGRPA